MIGLEEFIERFCALGSGPGRRPFPRRQRDREILMKSIRMRIEPQRIYSEPEINALLRAWSHELAPSIESDFVAIRRLLVDYGHLERPPDGSAYRLGFPTRPAAFALAIDELDLRAVVAAYREHLQQRRFRV
jgi:hypothetical protein